MKRTILLILPAFLFLLSSCGEMNSKEKAVNTEAAITNVTESVDLTAETSEYIPDSLLHPEAQAVIYTSFGAMQVKLYDETPRHRDNFLKLAAEGFFDGTLFHRVIRDFMIQGGDPDSRNAPAVMKLGNGGPGYTVPAEFIPTLLHKKGALSAARQSDMANPKKESSGSQFYIVQGKKYSNEELSQIEAQSGKVMDMEVRRMYRTLGGTPFLDHEYTVFGEVVEGLEVIDAITAMEVNADNRPLQDIKMEVRVRETQITE